MFQIELEGREYDWLAIDAAGNVALFCTAGGGHAPSDVVPRLDAHLAAIEAIEQLDATTVAMEGLGKDEWSRLAARGVFVYDADYMGGPFKRECAPVVAVSVSDLPDAIAAIARRVQFLGLFRELLTIPNATIDGLG